MEIVSEQVNDATDAILIFPERPDDGEQAADMRTIATLLTVRAALGERHPQVRIISEVLDANNLDLAAMAKPDDTVISEQMISLHCLQLSQQPELENVYDDLLGSRGTNYPFTQSSGTLQSGTQQPSATASGAKRRTEARIVESD